MKNPKKVLVVGGSKEARDSYINKAEDEMGIHGSVFYEDCKGFGVHEFYRCLGYNTPSPNKTTLTEWLQHEIFMDFRSFGNTLGGVELLDVQPERCLTVLEEIAKTVVYGDSVGYVPPFIVTSEAIEGFSPELIECFDSITDLTQNKTYTPEEIIKIHRDKLFYRRTSKTQTPLADGKDTETPALQAGREQEKAAATPTYQWGIDRNTRKITLSISKGVKTYKPERKALFSIFEKLWDNEGTPVSFEELCKVARERGYARDYVVDLKNGITKQLNISRDVVEKIIAKHPLTGKIKTYTFHKNPL